MHEFRFDPVQLPAAAENLRRETLESRAYLQLSLVY